MENTFVPDLSNCDREPIHIPGFIQPHGFLLALHPSSGAIEKLSANFTDFTGLEAASVLGKTIQALEPVIKPAREHSSFSELLQLTRLTGNLEQLNPQPVLVNGREMFVIVHQHNGLMICEFEPVQRSDDHITLQAIMSSSLAVIQSAADFSKLLDRVAGLIKQITGYSRIMIYKFHRDHHGEVVAEAKDDDLESWLHLHYPASDIPAQARELYKLNLVRLIADVNSQPSGLLSRQENMAPLDLTHSVLRAVSPIHIEYLKNMEVGASFSISLISKNELWGLIACHNSTPRFIDYNARTACKFIGQLFSAALEFKSNEESEEKNTLFRDKQVILFAQMMKEMEPVEALINSEVNLLHMSNATGAVLCYEGKMHTLGNTPSEEEVNGIIDWIKKTEHGSFVQTAQLPYHYTPARKIAAVASGIMATEIAHDWAEFIIWFKPEIVHTVDWAGEPLKSISKEEDGSMRISPRKSFAKWTEQVQYTAEEWSNAEIAAAMKLREDVIQVINKKATEIRKLNELLKEAYDELDTFSFTVSHDLRTPLSSIKNYSEIILEDHASELSPQATELFKKVVKGTDKMAGLIRDVLQYSRVGRAAIERTDIDMKRLLTEIREELLAPQAGRDIRFVIKNTPAVHGDRTMIMLLFTNLAGNAVKYSTNVPQAVIEIDGKQEGDFVVYTIEDNGIGIDMKYASRIFELFKRMDNVKSIEGTGVGLAIAKRIVEKHAGKIWLESRLNAGTKFYIGLPVK